MSTIEQSFSDRNDIKLLVLNAIPVATYLVTKAGDILFYNPAAEPYIKRHGAVLKSPQLCSIFKNSLTTIGYVVQIDGIDYLINASSIVHDYLGIITVVTIDDSSVSQLINHHLNNSKAIIDDLQTIFDNSYDVLYVSDGNGITLRASSACEELWGKKPHELIGRSVYDLETEGVYYPSATRIVLERKKKVQIIQKTKTGRQLMVTSTPVFDLSGNVIRVVNASRDITEIQELENEIQNLRDIVAGYQNQLSQLQVAKNAKDGELIYRSKQMEQIIALLGRIAQVDSTVLITGESGVGKEVIANHIHACSSRVDNPFIKVNCAAIPQSLLESELFGYAPGTFTGGQKNGKAGLFELANTGTIFLDEIGDMQLDLQTKILRVLQEREVTRIGSHRSIPLDIRFIVATNQDLTRKVEEGSFRLDLYYRLNVIPINVPPLRERREDVLPIFNHFLHMYIERFHRRSVTLSQEALSIIESYDWPGNVRELKNIVERLMVTTNGTVIDVTDLPINFTRKQSMKLHQEDSKAYHAVEVHELLPLKDATDCVEKQLIELASRNARTLSDIATLLKVNQSTISRKVQKYNMNI
ncbi:sigma-54 interaction domain-containing protein [Alicyclobacillus dauci]|uniref:Sigma 54-interacting transcriptional regulator n=1 Tax=Alicyclobacillus dauci TaxID=1475485 RepID=A0ABY6Z0U8_9BACL|nr:sigma 54-interacting transcriptional regulator [Alicyclobacillus dauci]WAH36467.1 sigma 54-interacting transcriptional regulator [Alicyclobacillus dauci]